MTLASTQPAPTNIDRKIRGLVDVLNGLGIGRTVDSCEGHDRGRATVFAGYERRPLLPLGVLELHKPGLAMRHPAYVDLVPHEDWRAQAAKLMAFIAHEVDRRLYTLESESVRVEVRPGDRFQLHFTHEWDARRGIYRSVHDMEMRVAFVTHLCQSFDPRAPWRPRISGQVDVHANLAYLRRFSPAKTYPLLDA